MPDDSQKLSRFAQPLFINHAKGVPPTYGDFEPVYGAKIENLVYNINAVPDYCIFWFPAVRWNDDSTDMIVGDMVRVVDGDGTIYFEGYITKDLREFSGGDGKQGGYERQAYMAQDIRYLFAKSVPIYGQQGRGYDDYEGDGSKKNTLTDFSGRRCIFNPLLRPGKPAKGNKDSDDAEIEGIYYPAFCDPSDSADKWKMFDMLRFVLSLIEDEIDDYFAIDWESINYLADIDEWKQSPSNITIEGLNAATAMQFLCKRIGWSYRIDYDGDDSHLVFFKSGQTDATSRDDTHPNIQQKLFAPAAMEEDVADSKKDLLQNVQAGKVLVQTAQFNIDIENIVNAPIYFGAKQRVEFTVELAPGWKDSDLSLEVGANLFLYDSQLEGMTQDELQAINYYKYYHPKGNSFKRDVGRMWVLNENGKYTGGNYDRGAAYDLSYNLPIDFAFDDSDKRTFGPFSREFLHCLTKDFVADCQLAPVVEFSFDMGETWRKIAASIENVDGQCGIEIKEPNLAQIKNELDLPITGGDLDGVELNYWTSLCDDKLDNRSFKNGEWYTRVRITVSVELDQRIYGQLTPDNSGSPFNQVAIWDHSNEYHQQAVHSSSIFTGKGLPSDARDDTDLFVDYIRKLRDSLQESVISGFFILERLWLNKFRIGDCITQIEGRDYDFKTIVGNVDESKKILYPEIVQIEILPQQQKMKLVTRNLNYGRR